MLIDKLKEIQEEHGYLPQDELTSLSEQEHIPLYDIHGVASFYPHFHLEPPPQIEVKVCTDMSCHLRGASRVMDEAKSSVSKLDKNKASVSEVSCLGQCDGAPAISINGRSYNKVAGEKLKSLMEKLSSGDLPRRQPMRVADTNFKIDPYKRSEPFRALRELLKSGDSQRCIQVLKESGLLGMGGAGFRTGLKWEIVGKEKSDKKYIICNADESEPGTCKDRVLMETLPDLMIEGMIIGGFVVGSDEGYIFIRHEYDRQREILERAIRACRDQGLIGSDILDSGFDFNISIFESPGGYICGEETALLEAMEGKRAEPRNKPPFPGSFGLWGKPTLINNVETFAFVPGILIKGSQWFKDCGANGSDGLKFLALSGHVRNPGVYEVPLGISARDFICKYGSGMVGNSKLKAFAPGGASSGFLPGEMADVALDFKALSGAGSMLGSGAVVAVADGTCMLDLAKNVIKFFRNESCGKCVPCRVGSQKLVDILEGTSRGEGTEQDLEPILELSEAMQLTSICGLGQAAPYPVLSVLKYFKDEVYDHIAKGKCPSGVCLTSRQQTVDSRQGIHPPPSEIASGLHPSQ